MIMIKNKMTVVNNVDYHMGQPEYENIEDSKEGEGDEVEEDEIHPGDVDLNVVRILARA